LVTGTTLDLNTNEYFDGAIMVNVLEHIEDDKDELKRINQLLKPSRGHLCLLIPARKEIYSKLDNYFGHFRRYHKEDLRQKLDEAGFEIKILNYFNFIGYFAWLVRFKIFQKMTFDIDQVSFFDRMIFPPSHWVESNVLRPPIGQSLIAIAQAK
jgi:SAM-dependent methyltransferase